MFARCRKYLFPAAVVICLAAAPDAVAGPVNVVDTVKADAGETVKVFANDTIKVTGTCEDNGGGDLTAATFLAAKRKNLVFDTYSGDSSLDFDPADGKADITTGDASGAAAEIEGADYYDLYVEGAGGRPISGRVVTTVHLMGSDCGFSGTFVGGSSGGPIRAGKRATADAGTSVKVFANRDLKITGACEDNGGGNYTANTFLSAKRKNLTYYLTELDMFDTTFGPSDPKVDFIIPGQDAKGTLPAFSSRSFDQDLWTESRDGKIVQMRIGTGVHIKGADCTFSSVAVGPKSSKDLKVVNRVRVAKGKSTVLFASKDFKVSARCIDNGAGDFTADTTLSAKRKNLVYYAYDTGDDVDFDPADGKIDITGYDATGTDPDYASEDDYTDFVGLGKGGKILTGRVATGVHTSGADCTFAGIFMG